MGCGALGSARLRTSIKEPLKDRLPRYPLIAATDCCKGNPFHGNADLEKRSEDAMAKRFKINCDTRARVVFSLGLKSAGGDGATPPACRASFRERGGLSLGPGF